MARRHQCLPHGDARIRRECPDPARVRADPGPLFCRFPESGRCGADHDSLLRVRSLPGRSPTGGLHNMCPSRGDLGAVRVRAPCRSDPGQSGCRDSATTPSGGPAKGLTTDELQRLLAALPSSRAGRRDRAIVILILLTGLRRSEVFSLRLRDVDFETGGYLVRVKGGRERRRRLPRPARDAILDVLRAEGRWPHASPCDGRLFSISASGFYARLRRTAASAGLVGVGPHVLRHSAAQLRRTAGASIEDVSALLGHASIATTARYLRLEPEDDGGWARAAAALGVADTTQSAGIGGAALRAPSRTDPPLGSPRRQAASR